MHDFADIPAASPSWMQGRLQRKCACGNHASTGGECEDCAKKRLHMKSLSHNQPFNEAPDIVHIELAAPGRPLDRKTQGVMQSRFGYDFSNVRVHADSHAAESARAVDALAYTVGNHVVFGAGQYAPHTRIGRHLLAHELAHTVQQRSMAPQRQHKLKIEPGHSADEPAADRAADAVVAGCPVPALAAAAPALRRKDAPDPLACDSAHADAISKANTTAGEWLGKVGTWFDEYAKLVKKRTPRSAEFRKVGDELFGKLSLLNGHFSLAEIIRKDYKSRFPTSAEWEGEFKEFETFGRAVFNIRRNFNGVKLNLTSHCEKPCPKGQNGADVAGSAHPGSNKYTIYTNCFDKQDAKAQAATVLHEAFHATYSTFSGDSYSSNKDYPGTDAINNADSYTTFASIVATGSSFRIQVLPETVIQAEPGPTP